MTAPTPAVPSRVQYSAHFDGLAQSSDRRAANTARDHVVTRLMRVGALKMANRGTLRKRKGNTGVFHPSASKKAMPAMDSRKVRVRPSAFPRRPARAAPYTAINRG